MINFNKLKIKTLEEDELILAVNRLTRFKHPKNKYERVFKDIFSKYLIYPKISFKEFDILDKEKIVSIIEEIFLYSIQKISNNFSSEYFLNKYILELENKIFDIDEDTKQLMSVRIPFDEIICLVREEKNLEKNLLFLKKLYENQGINVKNVREKYLTKFPIEKVILVEGITEETLLPEFAKVLNYDFDQNGIKIIAAGGKNQVAKLYLQLSRQLKIPIMILLDADAQEISEKISKRLRDTDGLILIQKGEFEDILPLNLIKKTINKKYKNILKINTDDLRIQKSMVKTLEELYRTDGLGEFKKAEFANDVASVIDKNLIISQDSEINHIISEIKFL